MKSISMQAAAFAKESAEAEITAAIKAAADRYHEKTGMCITHLDVDIIKLTSYGDSDKSVICDVKLSTSAGTRL